MQSVVAPPGKQTERTTRASMVQLFLNFGVKHGLDPDALCAAGGFSQQDLTRPEQPVPQIWFESVASAVVAKLPHLAVGIELGMFTGPEQGVRQGYLGQALKYVPTPLAALEMNVRGLRHVDSVLDTEQGRVRLIVDSARVTYEVPAARFYLPECVESMFVATLVGLRASATAEIEVCEVRFSRVREALRARLERIFGCAVRFGCDVDALVFARGPLEKPCRNVDSAAARRFEEQLERRMQRDGDKLSLALRSAIDAGLRAGDVAQAHIAKQFGMSTRSLQRKLRERGVRYQTVLDQARKEHAKRLLEDCTKQIAEVAGEVGYDCSSFNRVFRRWCGMSPSEYRKTWPRTAI